MSPTAETGSAGYHTFLCPAVWSRNRLRACSCDRLRGELIGPKGVTKKRMDFFAFQKPYVDRLREGDPATEQHFASFVGKFLRIKLRARMLSPDAVDDLTKETLLRVIAKLRSCDGSNEPERFGNFVLEQLEEILQRKQGK